ncbi:MAG: class I adenylate-forming enzyme family protein [Acidimicrobiia bacterium]
MHVPLLLEMTSEMFGDRRAVGEITHSELAARARAAAAFFESLPGERVVMIDLNSEAVPICLFGAAFAGRPFVPVNYRLTDDQLRAIVVRTAPATAIVGVGVADRLGPIDGVEVVEREVFLERCAAGAADDTGLPTDIDPQSIAVLLFTSGTTGEPKAAVLRHENLANYIFSTVELGGADEDEAALVAVPPYHIAGVAAVLSSTYAGRRIVYLESFDPATWVDTIERERITNAMVVPTMFGRVLDEIERAGTTLPTLRNLAYGGGPMPLPVIERAMRVLPHVGFVNAYGLTETASTIAVLTPDDHREAWTSDDPAVRRRLGSVGRPLATLEVTVRDPAGDEVPVGVRGEVWVRGPQVSGEYLGRGGLADGGWFNTRDAGEFDEGGYLFVHGRLDDVIVRGGENLSPGEIEAVLIEHPAVAQAAVVGIPDEEWGERVVAAVVLEPGASVTEDELKELVRSQLRSTRTPERIQFRDELPSNETGKLLRRVLRQELSEAVGNDPSTRA